MGSKRWCIGRHAIRRTVLLLTVALVACSGDEPEPPPLAERFVSAADAPGSTIDTVEVRETADDIDTFVSVFSPHMVDADREEMTQMFSDADFQSAGTEVRFIGQEHSPEEPHIFSSFYELGSEDGAASALDWLVSDSQKPCPESCATVVSEFDVYRIPDGSGVRRLTTADAIEAAGTDEQIPPTATGWPSPSAHPSTRWNSPDLPDPSPRKKLERSRAPTTTG